MVLAAVVGIANVVAWHIWRTKKRPSHPADFVHNATRNRLDIGEAVVVPAWRDDGSTHVSYRGATWSAVALDPSAPHHPGGRCSSGTRQRSSRHALEGVDVGREVLPADPA